MLVYNYNPNTKEYTGSEEACLNVPATRREGKNVYLLPAHATFKKVPNLGEHETALFNLETEKWKKYPDYRGCYIVNDDMQVILVKELGQIPEGYIVINETQAKTIMGDSLYYIIEDGQLVPNPNYDEDVLANAKQIKYEEAKNGAYIYLEGGNALYEFDEGKHIEATDGNIGKFTAYALGFMAGSTTPVVWSTKEDETVLLNAEQVTDILQGLGAVQAQVWTVKFADYVTAIQEAETVEDVNAIVINYEE